MTTTHSSTATVKRETRDAFTAAGFAVAKIAASPSRVNVTLADEADLPAVLAAFPGATAPYADSASSTSRRLVLIPR